MSKIKTSKNVKAMPKGYVSKLPASAKLKGKSFHEKLAARRK